MRIYILRSGLMANLLIAWLCIAGIEGVHYYELKQTCSGCDKDKKCPLRRDN